MSLEYVLIADLPEAGAVNPGDMLTVYQHGVTKKADASLFKGADGKAPVKGVDYFTDADKAEMVQAVLAALPNAEGVGF